MRTLVLLLVILSARFCGGQRNEDEAYFESNVRPLLSERCFECHRRKAEGGLRLDSAAAIASGGVTGPAVVPGDPANSLLWQAVAGKHVELSMPPDAPLDEAEVEILRKWIATGAHWPKSSESRTGDISAQGSDGFVVLDTAPTGHTVLLLDSALAYHREVTRQLNQMPEAVEQLLPRLRDPDYTRVLIVTLPEATPVHEAASLQRDLRRAEIEPYAWVINQCLSPLTIHDPLLQERQLHEEPYIREVMEKQSHRTVLIPWQIDPPVGKIGLEHLLQNTDLSIAKA